jgi:transcriptional regulator with XRE-family HTH domain
MTPTLTIQEKFKDLRIERGLTLEQLSEQIGISKSALGYYENDDNKDISHVSVLALAKFYGVSTDYLFGLTEEKNHLSADLSELHLSDEMIELLKTGKINSRLLCEMASHPEFVKFMADIEIFADGIATMQIRNLNVWVNTVQAEIVQRYNPSDDDFNMQALNAAHINEDDYFAERIHFDLDKILWSIRDAHKNDSTSATTLSPVDDLKRSLEEAANFKGSETERLLMVFCAQTHLNYKKLTEEEAK